MVKKNKHYRRRLTVFGTISVLVIIVFLYNLISYIKLVNNLENEQINLQNKLVQLQKDNYNLKEEIEKLKNPEYLAKYARENFLYSKEGEYIIRIDDNNKITLELNEDNVKYRKTIIIILASSIFILLIIFIIIRKNKRSLDDNIEIT